MKNTSKTWESEKKSSDYKGDPTYQRSQNHRKLPVGIDLKDHPVQPSKL